MEISVQSLIASKTGEPAVELSIGGRPVQMDVKSARGIGLQLIEAAEAAQSDSIVYELLKPMGNIAQQNMVIAMRAIRERMDNQV